MLVDTILAPLGASLVDWVAPPLCPFCKGPDPSGPACAACRNALPWNDPACRSCGLPLLEAASTVCGACLEHAPPQGRTWTAFRYEPPVIQQIVALKFRADFRPARTLGALLAERLARRAAPLPEILVPVPLHPARLRRRGYNQSLEIARVLCSRLSMKLAPELARRRHATAEQTQLAAAERRRNVRGAFEVDAGVAGRHVALLDDVITTGATAAELAGALRRAGAASVEAWAVARAV